MTVFSNWKTLNEKVVNGDFEGVISEFSQSTIEEQSTYDGVVYSAKESYRKICKLFNKNGHKVPKQMSDRASDIFADVWDVEALLMIEGESSKYGKLTPKALEVLKEYKRWRKRAEEVYKENYYKNDFEVKIEDGIVVKVNGGRVSFIRKGEEYVVYFPEH